jgi:dipeptidyl aminopeptidase/acylaminoacyl peptidase
LAGATVPELVEVADIASLSASPSGRKVVFRIERASIERNSYDLEWYVADLASGAVRRIADGGAPIEGGLEPLSFETVVWSPDERFVFHRALVDGAIGIWRTAVDGSGSRPVVVADADVESLAATADGTALDYVLGPTREEIARAERREYDEGILVDGSVDINQTLYHGGWVNGRLASQRLTGQWFVRAGLLWRAPRQRHRLDLLSLESLPLESVSPDVAPHSASAETVFEEPGRPTIRMQRTLAGSTIEVEGRDGPAACDDTACSARISNMAWRPGTEELGFTTQDGHFRQTLHLWNVRSGTVRTVVQAEGLIAGSRTHDRPCAFTHEAAVCVAAGAVSPPRLERIDLVSGERRVLFDPNPLLRQREMPRVEQLRWTLADGREATGTLLLPPNLRGPAPLFVNYYICPGYLRAGTGDEYPLPALVDAGFAVGCLNMVPGEGNNMVEHHRTGLASVEAFVRLLSARGLVDPVRVGMGGFSFGSEVTTWVAMHSDLLAAAAIASPQTTPSYYWSNALPGRDFVDASRQSSGMGSPDEDPEGWRAISPVFNTDRIKAPLLMQLPEMEARDQVDILARLASTPTPVELYAFPDENHIKFQPRHRLAAYRRSIDWFRYWLQDYVDPDPAKAAQYDRWNALRHRRDESQESNPRSHVSAEDRSSKRM